MNNIIEIKDCVFHIKDVLHFEKSISTLCVYFHKRENYLKFSFKVVDDLNENFEFLKKQFKRYHKTLQHFNDKKKKD